MGRTKILVAVLIGLTTPVAAANVDLILPPALESADAPIYHGAKVKIGDTTVPVKEAPLPPGQAAAYQPEKGAVVVSNRKDISEEVKSQALLEVLQALEAGAVAPAAGEESATRAKK